jgi:hypothetical protein
MRKSAQQDSGFDIELAHQNRPEFVAQQRKYVGALHISTISTTRFPRQ